MKIASILPTAYLPMIADKDYHMALAQLLDIKSSNAYTKFYKNMGSAYDKYLILDNGAAEGEAIPFVTLLKAGKYIGANEIIIPDTLCNINETLNQAFACIEHMDILCDDEYRPKIMLVPQGKDLEEWLECFNEMQVIDYDTVGIPKILCKMAGPHARMKMLMAIASELKGREVHLLGCHNDPTEIRTIQQLEERKLIAPVRGVDSAMPYVYTKGGQRINGGELRPNIPFKFTERNLDSTKMKLLEVNIKEWSSLQPLEMGLEDIVIEEEIKKNE